MDGLPGIEIGDRCFVPTTPGDGAVGTLRYLDLEHRWLGLTNVILVDHFGGWTKLDFTDTNPYPLIAPKVIRRLYQ